MSNISTIFTGCSTVIQSTLGVDWSKLEHVVRIEENKWSNNTKRWGLLPSAGDAINGETRANTLNQGMRLMLVGSYVTTVLGDGAVVDQAITMLGLLEDVFKQLVLQKCGAPSVVTLVHGFAPEETLVMHKEKIIIVEGRFFVRSQINF